MQARKAGAVEFIRKPFGPEVLVAAVREAFSDDVPDWADNLALLPVSTGWAQ